MLSIISARVLPAQMRFPPLKAQKARGFLGLPSGRLYIGDCGLKRSGLNSFGLIQTCGSFQMAWKLMMKVVLFFLKSTPPILTSQQNKDGIEDGPGGWILRDSYTHCLVQISSSTTSGVSKRTKSELAFSRMGVNSLIIYSQQALFAVKQYNRLAVVMLQVSSPAKNRPRISLATLRSLPSYSSSVNSISSTSYSSILLGPFYLRSFTISKIALFTLLLFLP